MNVIAERYSLYLGDCLEVMKGLPDNSMDLIATSPPYNCGKDYGATFTDSMPWAVYYEWIGLVLDECYRVLHPGGVLAVNVPNVMRWQARHEYAHTWSDYDSGYRTHRNGAQVSGKARIEPIGFRLFAMMQQRDPHIREPIVWVKGDEGEVVSTNYQMGCDSDPFLRSAHEMILLGSKERWFHRGGTGRRGGEAVPFEDETKDVWFVPPVTDRLHPATWPTEIPSRLIRLFVHANDAVVLDPFMGVGSTGLAAEPHGCRFVGIEIDPNYFSIAAKRIADAHRASQCLPKELRGKDKDFDDMPLFAEVVDIGG